MTVFPFEIEFIDPQGRYVLARQLGREGFRLGAGSKLGEAEVVGVSQPKARGPDGTPRLDIFGFKLKEPSAAQRLRVGQTVELKADATIVPKA